jgi:hypothetical protein
MSDGNSQVNSFFEVFLNVLRKSNGGKDGFWRKMKKVGRKYVKIRVGGA